MAIKLKRGLEATIPTLKEGEPGFTTDTKKLFIGSNAGNIEVGGGNTNTIPLVEVTWQELKDLRDSSALVPGREYRITDYECTTVQANTQSAGHQFDIIVTADDVDKLNENARACLHEGDTYFANSKLEAWKLKYCLDNDTDRFAWADEVNGKGVIYRMIDEFNNDCPYDFKNIMFYHSVDELYYYTFTVYDDGDTEDIVDVSTIQNRFKNDENGYSAVSGNIIKPWLQGPFNDDIGEYSYISIKLNEIMFINKTSYDHFYGIEGNIFGLNCYRNTFGNSCYNNTFGNDCYNNTFGNDCYNNTFGNSCSSNTFGNYCSSNAFGDRCYSNTFGNDCYNNTFGNDCSYNTFGDRCYSNTFGNDCYDNTFGDDCSHNTFGNYCVYLQISNNSGTKYISVENGFNGASSANKFDLYDPAILNKNYQVTFKKSASGKYLMLWATDTGTMTGKFKATNTSATWEDIV